MCVCFSLFKNRYNEKQTGESFNIFLDYDIYFLHIFAAVKCVAAELKSKVLSLSATCFDASDLSLHCCGAVGFVRLKETQFSSAWKKEKSFLWHRKQEIKFRDLFISLNTLVRVYSDNRPVAFVLLDDFIACRCPPTCTVAYSSAHCSFCRQLTVRCRASEESHLWVRDIITL